MPTNPLTSIPFANAKLLSSVKPVDKAQGKKSATTTNPKVTGPAKEKK